MKKMRYISSQFSMLIAFTFLFTPTYLCIDSAEDSMIIQESKWYQVYEASGTQEALSLALTQDDGYVLAGWSSKDDAAFMIKTDEVGNQEWNLTYGSGPSDVEAYDVIESSDGGYVLTGYKESGGLFILKTDSTGNILWDKIHTKGTWGKSIVEVIDGFVIMGVSGVDTWLIKTNTTGDLIWERTFGGSSGDTGESLFQTADAGFIMTGITYSYDIGGGDIWVIKTDENGVEQWNRTYGGNGYDKGSDVIETRDGCYVIVGGVSAEAAGWVDLFIMKIDTQGNEIWTKCYGGSDGEAAKKVVQTADGSYVLTAATQSYGLSIAGGSEAWILKLDENGDMIWNKMIGGRGTDTFADIVESADGSFILTGLTESFGKDGYDAWLVKCDDYPPPTLTLLNPEENMIYIGDRKILPSKNTIILGKKTIEVSINDPDERLQQVEFYVESSFGALYEHQIYTAPYRWVFDEPIGSYCYIGVAGYYSANGAHVAEGLFPWMFNM